MSSEASAGWEDSGNDTSSTGHLGTRFFLANCLILLPTSFIGVAANLFVILAFYRQKSLQTWNNALVVNLAVIDILRCAIDSPLLLTIVITVHRKGRADELICDAHVASFSFSCCIQLLTLASISAERYQAIAQPFKTSQRRKRVMVLIPLTWTLAILVAVFCLTFVTDSPLHMRCSGYKKGVNSTTLYDTFGLYILFPLWAACFGVIIWYYTRIFFLVRSHNRKIFDKGMLLVSTKEKKQMEGETTTGEIAVHAKPEQSQILSVAESEVVSQAEAKPSKKGSTTSLQGSTKAPSGVSIIPESKSTLVITDLETEPRHSGAQNTGTTFKTVKSSSTEEKAGAKSSKSDAPIGVKSSTSTAQKEQKSLGAEKQSKVEMNEAKPHPLAPAQVEKPESSSVLTTAKKSSSGGGEALAVAAKDQAFSLTPVSIMVSETDAGTQSVEVEGAVCMMPSKAGKERAHKKKESKMAKRAGYIIITFLLFWLPLITTILVNFIVHKNKHIMMITIKDVEILSVSVACITSLSDPIIYAAVNPQFRNEFCRIKNRVKSTFNKK